MTEKNRVNVGVDRSLSNSEMYEHICIENIRKLYNSSGKFDEQKQYKAIIKEAMVSTPEGFSKKSTMSPSQYMTAKNPSANKLLYHFLEAL